MVRGPGVPFNDLQPAYRELDTALQAACDRVLRSGWYVHGPEHDAFEEEFASFVGSSGCVAVGNGTDALEIAMRALDPPLDSTVVTVANAAMYGTTAAMRVGLHVRFADVSRDTLLIDVGRLADVLDDRVSIVVVTHLYGRMADVEAIVSLCHQRGIQVVEDCAQAVGARRGGRPAGSMGDAAAFSFYPTKNLGAVGDGGAITSSRSEVLERARQLRQYGWSTKYRVAVDGGRNSRLDELQAAFLRVKLPHVDVWNRRRVAILERYEQAAGAGLQVLPSDGAAHVAHLAVVIAEDREAWRARLSDRSVGSEVHYPVPDHRQPIMAGRHERTSLPVTEWACDRVLSLPVFPQMTDAQVDIVCDVIGA